MRHSSHKPIGSLAAPHRLIRPDGPSGWGVVAVLSILMLGIPAMVHGQRVGAPRADPRECGKRKVGAPGALCDVPVPLSTDPGFKCETVACFFGHVIGDKLEAMYYAPLRTMAGSWDVRLCVPGQLSPCERFQKIEHYKKADLEAFQERRRPYRDSDSMPLPLREQLSFDRVERRCWLLAWYDPGSAREGVRPYAVSSGFFISPNENDKAKVTTCRTGQ